MKTIGKFLAAAVITVLPSLLMAQEIRSEKPASFLAIDSVPKPDLKIMSKLPLKNDVHFPFQYHLPSRFSTEPKEIIIEEPQMAYHMPIVKPGKTSKILIGKLDPDFPYRYNMPVLKDGEVIK